MVLSYFLKSGKESVLLCTDLPLCKVTQRGYLQELTLPQRITSSFFSAFCFPSNKGCIIVMARESRIILSYEGIDDKR